ncbi:unnamed protein product [Somion occarium]|uniref:Uncharacterized protein n=1 Tax=Somion occarium TaxID=3059160 RepID=A0ABP1CVN4_9APHY
MDWKHIIRATSPFSRVATDDSPHMRQANVNACTVRPPAGFKALPFDTMTSVGMTYPERFKSGSIPALSSQPRFRSTDFRAGLLGRSKNSGSLRFATHNASLFCV